MGIDPDIKRASYGELRRLCAERGWSTDHMPMRSEMESALQIARSKERARSTLYP